MFHALCRLRRSAPVAAPPAARLTPGHLDLRTLAHQSRRHPVVQTQGWALQLGAPQPPAWPLYKVGARLPLAAQTLYVEYLAAETPAGLVPFRAHYRGRDVDRIDLLPGQLDLLHRRTTPSMDPRLALLRALAQEPNYVLPPAVELLVEELNDPRHRALGRLAPDVFTLEPVIDRLNLLLDALAPLYEPVGSQGLHPLAFLYDHVVRGPLCHDPHLYPGQDVVWTRSALAATWQTDPLLDLRPVQALAPAPPGDWRWAGVAEQLSRCWSTDLDLVVQVSRGQVRGAPEVRLFLDRYGVRIGRADHAALALDLHRLRPVWREAAAIWQSEDPALDGPLCVRLQLCASAQARLACLDAGGGEVAACLLDLAQFSYASYGSARGADGVML